MQSCSGQARVDAAQPVRCSVMLMQPEHQQVALPPAIKSPSTAANISGSVAQHLRACSVTQSAHILYEVRGMLLAADLAHVWHAKDADNLALQHSWVGMSAVLAGTQGNLLGVPRPIAHT